MKTILFAWLLGAVLALGAGRGAQAQPSCLTPNPPACTFKILDVTASPAVEVDALCVGRSYRFDQCPGRGIAGAGIPPTSLFYEVRRGLQATSPGCNPPNQGTTTTGTRYVYTAQAADVGTVTISELSNQVGSATYYIREVRVYSTPPPIFALAPCPNGLVLVTVTDAAYDRYTVRVGAGPAQAMAPNQPTTLPVPAGATSVTVTGQYLANGLCEGTNTQALAPLPPAQVPVFTRLTLDGPLPGGVATLDVGQLPAGYLYTLQLADASAPGGYRDLDAVAAGSSSLSITSPTAGCYRLFRTDACGTATAASPPICTLSLAGASARNRNQLLLSDGGTASGTTYRVTRDGQPLTTFTVIPGGLEDANVVCGTRYTYRVTAVQPGGGLAVSNPVVIATQSALPPEAPQLLATFNLRNVVELSPLLPPGSPLPAGSTLRYRRAAGGLAPIELGTATSARPLRDSVALADLLAQPPCYSLRLVDVCGNASPESAAMCPALLTARAADPTGNTAALAWTPFTGPDPRTPAAYTLQRLAADGTVFSTAAVSGTAYLDLTPPADRQVLRYRLQISGAGLPAGTFSYSNLATITRRLSVTLPTAFTPNGDGLNDVLEVKGQYLRNYAFVVVDRNGQEVFRGTQRADAWDGTIRGHAPVPGAYVWRFQQADETGGLFTETGSVTILK